MFARMAAPEQPVTLDVAQIEELARHFSSFRHDVNGCLSLIVAATELIRYNPDVIKRMAGTLVDQPPRIAGKVREFVGECERALGLRPADAGWYLALWKRSNMVAAPAPHGVPLSSEQTRTLHSDLMQLGKELGQLGFVISGSRALAGLEAGQAAELLPNVADQFTKAALKFDQFATKFEQAVQITESTARRLATGSPTGPITFAPAQLEVMARRLGNLQRDLNEQLLPLLELSRLARHAPQQLQTRAGEFMAQPPKISAIIATFGDEFDRNFTINRAG